MFKFICFILLILNCSIFASAEKKYLVHLKKNAVLYSLQEKKYVVLPEGVFAYVSEIDPQKRDTFLVYNKKGEVLYQADANDISEIDQVTEIFPKSSLNREYPPKDTLKAENAEMHFSNFYNFYLDVYRLSELGSIYPDQQNIAVSPLYEFKTLYQTDFPIQPGFAGNLQMIYFNSANEQIKMTILSFGPQFFYPITKKNDFQLGLSFGAEFAPIYQASFGSKTEKYTAGIYHLGLDSQWHTFLGEFALGFNLKRHQLTLDSSTRSEITQYSHTMSIDSFGFLIGYVYNWSL